MKMENKKIKIKIKGGGLESLVESIMEWVF